MLFNEAKYDRRLIEIGQIPPDYEDYLKSLKCCVCGSREPCICTKEDFKSLSKRIKSKKIVKHTLPNVSIDFPLDKAFKSFKALTKSKDHQEIMNNYYKATDGE